MSEFSIQVLIFVAFFLLLVMYVIREKIPTNRQIYIDVIYACYFLATAIMFGLWYASTGPRYVTWTIYGTSPISPSDSMKESSFWLYFIIILIIILIPFVLLFKNYT